MSSVALNPPLIVALERDVSPLRVAVYLADQNPQSDRDRGITAMTQSLLAKLARREDLLITQIISRSSYAESRDTIETRTLPFRTDRTVGRLVAAGLHAWLVRPPVDLWYYPKGHVSRIAGNSTPSIGTLHDTMVQHYADHYPGTRSQRAFRSWLANTKRSLSRHACVMTVSQHAAGQLTDFCERYRIDPPPIKVTYQGSEWESYRRIEYEKSDFVLHLASVSPHKQTNTLLQMWKQLQRQNSELPKLCLVGELNDEGQQLYQATADVSLEPPVAREELRDLMSRARAMLLPSETGGFGLPALEAYYLGTPVCYVRATATAEIVQDSQQRGGFDLGDAASLRMALDNVLKLSRSEIIRISNAMYELFSTERVAERVIRVMRDCVIRETD
jgi:glycosyltransferase involved in cell wall biosynthesis